MNKTKLKQAIKKAEKDMDYRIEFYCGEVLTGLIYGGDPVECGYYPWFVFLRMDFNRTIFNKIMLG